MRILKKLYLTLLFTAILVSCPAASLVGSSATAQAATIKITHKTLTVEAGKTRNLTIKGTKKKVSWSSSNKVVATVSSKGTVTAKSVGTATITAVVSSRKFICKVTVTKPVNPYLKNAPFHAVETKLEGYNFVMPSDWEMALDIPSENSYSFTLIPPDATLDSKIVIDFLITGEKAASFTVLKEEVAKRLTLDSVTKQYGEIYGDKAFTINNFTQAKFKATFGSIMRTQYSLAAASSFEQCIYDFYLDNYYIEVTTYDYEKLALSTIAEYVINSIQAVQ